MVDVERAFARNRIEIAWLACAIGNDRAAHFYERNGWLRAGLKTIHLELPTGHFPLEVWRYEKRIGCS
jgi:hypothetical protein